MKFFQIRNWEKFQHYKKRNPPWIRLYQTLLRDPRFFVLPDACRYHLIGLFLLASQHGNKIPSEQEWLRHELGTKTAINLNLLHDSEWIEYIPDDASRLLAEAEMLAERQRLATEKALRDRGTETDNSETDNSETDTQAMYGKFENVKLSGREHSELVLRFGSDGTASRIETLSEYVASKGKKYSSHYATILTWERKNGNGSGRDKPVRETDHEKNQRAIRDFVVGTLAPEVRGDIPDVREDLGGLPWKA